MPAENDDRVVFGPIAEAVQSFFNVKLGSLNVTSWCFLMT
jgi:hypothetical protein